MPSFKIDLFTGHILSGDVYIRNMLSVFKSNAVLLLFLSDADYCRQNLAWSSGTFASQLRNSITESSIMSFLATVLGTEGSCAVCWARVVVCHISSAELKVGRVLHLWQDFFKLSCDDKDDFLQLS